ncbi:restriction endonuclease subunit S [Helicobacter apodemus]|nr:restriction endonuclease subunit S [Helicobacter apodemus]
MINKTTWQRVKLGEVAEINPPESIKKNTLAKKVSMDNLEPFNKKIYSFSMESFKGGSKFKNGDTLLARITPCLENGKTAFVDFLENNEIAFGSTEFIVLRQRENISDKHFLYYLARSENFRETAIKSMTGSSGRERVQIEVIRDYEFLLPPLEIQHKIAEILSSLDDKIDLLHRQNKTLESLALTLFRHTFIENPKNPNVPCHFKSPACHSDLECNEREESQEEESQKLNRDSSVFAKLQNNSKSVVGVGESLRGGGSDFALVSQETSLNLHIQAPPLPHKKDSTLRDISASPRAIRKDFTLTSKYDNAHTCKGDKAESTNEKWQIGKLGDYVMPKKGKNITQKNAIKGIYPVIAGGLEPAYYHNQSNTESPVITISASGANAGFVNIHYRPVWSSDSSYIDQTITPYVYFFYLFLKINQNILYDKQEGSAQPHIYPSHIMELEMPHYPKELIEVFETQIQVYFNKISHNMREILNLQSMRDMLLSKILNEKIEV